jgi:hypothetical protein
MGMSSGPSSEVLSEQLMLAIHRLSIAPGAATRSYYVTICGPFQDL